jgi:hypothetical protein
MIVLELFVAGRILATVDRVEGDKAVVEWADGSLSDVPLGALPAGTREGDRLRVHTLPRRVVRRGVHPGLASRSDPKQRRRS